MKKKNVFLVMTMVMALLISTMSMAVADDQLPSQQGDSILNQDSLVVEAEGVDPIFDPKVELVDDACTDYSVEFAILVDNRDSIDGTTESGAVEFSLTGFDFYGEGDDPYILSREAGSWFRLSPNPVSGPVDDVFQAAPGETVTINVTTDKGDVDETFVLDPDVLCDSHVSISFGDVDSTPVSVGEDFHFSVQLTNSGAMVENLTVGVEVSRADGIEEDDLEVKYKDDAGIWQDLTFQPADDVLYLYFGDEGGFEVGNGYDATTEFRANFDVADTFTGSVYAIDLDA